MSGKDGTVALVNKVDTIVKKVILEVAKLSFGAIRAIYLWWTGNITGPECCKTVVDSVCSAVGAIAGAASGASIGSCFGPVGTTFGAITGGLTISYAAKTFSENMTDKLFGLEKDKALKNAFQFFSLKENASYQEIKTEYHEMCLKYHPDKGGNSLDFRYVQVNLAIIKAAKGKLKLKPQ